MTDPSGILSARAVCDMVHLTLAMPRGVLHLEMAAADARVVLAQLANATDAAEQWEPQTFAGLFG